MATLVVDTDVFSYITANNPKRGIPYKRHLEGNTIALSFITVGELYAGYEKKIARAQWPEDRREKLELLLTKVVIIPYDAEICRTYGRLGAALKNPDGTDRVMAPNDLWIAASAVRHGLALVTNNEKHFAGIPGLKLITEPAP